MDDVGELGLGVHDAVFYLVGKDVYAGADYYILNIKPSMLSQLQTKPFLRAALPCGITLHPIDKVNGDLELIIVDNILKLDRDRNFQIGYGFEIMCYLFLIVDFETDGECC